MADILISLALNPSGDKVKYSWTTRSISWLLMSWVLRQVENMNTFFMYFRIKTWRGWIIIRRIINIVYTVVTFIDTYYLCPVTLCVSTVATAGVPIITDPSHGTVSLWHEAFTNHPLKCHYTALVILKVIFIGLVQWCAVSCHPEKCSLHKTVNKTNFQKRPFKWYWQTYTQSRMFCFGRE